MNGFIRGINEKLHRQGRYGLDGFSRKLLITAAVAFVLGLLLDFWLFSLYAVLTVVWSCVRIFSKNTGKRAEELETYEDMVKRRKENAALRKRKWTDRKTHRYFRCKCCDTVFRVPKGKGKISVTCPGCKEQFIKNT